MVWFYLHAAPPSYLYVAVTFQSHYGLILSGLKMFGGKKKEESFNPTMVWFYRSSQSAYIRYMSIFQSHYGLILSQ